MAETPDSRQPYPLLYMPNLIATICIALLGGFISAMLHRLSYGPQTFSNLVQKRHLDLDSRPDVTKQSAELRRKAKVDMAGITSPWVRQ
jgi:hypothetical protein